MGQYDSIEPIFWASGAALFVKAKVFHQLNGFDEYFFAHQEEIDLCWRMQLTGYKVMACPLSKVYHVGGGTLPKGNQKKVYLNFRNNLIMLAKNLPGAQAAWKIPFRILLDAVSALKSVFAGEAAYSIAVAEAHLGFLRWFFTKKTGAVLAQQKTVTLYGWYRKSVVRKYFISGKKTFAEIVGDNR